MQDSPASCSSARWGLLFLVAIVSGVVLYWPFTRRLRFGTIRDDKSRRILWLDWHDLLGAVTIAWALVVGGTGAINTLAEIMLNQWKSTELAAMVAPYAGKPAPVHLASLDATVAKAKTAAPGMNVAFIAFPGTPFTSSHHFAAFMRGDTPLTARLLKPVLLDGETAEVADKRDLPLYLRALLVSQPLHFGDYGGTPLKIIWALLDVMTIVVIGSGIYLWSVRRRKMRRGTFVVAGDLIVAAIAMTATYKSRASGNWLDVYGGPLVIGVLSLAGLLAALLFEGAGRYFCWIALGTPIAVTIRFFIRRKNPK